FIFFFFFKQKTAYEISRDWSSDVCSSDLFLYAIFAGIFTTFLFYNTVSKLKRTMFLFDSLGIAFFTVLGVEKTLSLGFRVEIAEIGRASCRERVLVLVVGV